MPSLVCVLEVAEETSIQRLANRRIDPITGVSYNMTDNPPSDEAINKRLVQAENDTELLVKKRYDQWTKFFEVIEESFKNNLMIINAEGIVQEVSNSVVDAIQNPLF